MKIIHGSALKESDRSLIFAIANECGILFDTARLLFYRGIDGTQKVKEFLTPGKHRFHNPFLLGDMEKAVERIKQAKAQNQTILVYGDYDADGVCATAVLYKCLIEFGVNVFSMIPEREDGYGLNYDKISKLNDETRIDLIITVDCGISDVDTIERLKNSGYDVIVTDHHEPPEELPKTLKINPKLKGQSYPFDGLCGAGVAYKLARALIGEIADKYLDLVALATVADSMELKDENRSIIVEGLKIFNSKALREPFKYMLGESAKTITAQVLAYQIAPKINAGGRMGDAYSALRLFLATDSNEIFDLAVKLNEYNIARQTECDIIYKQARAQILQNKLYENRVILVADSNWKTGFIGIVAAKLVEDFKRPVMVFAGQDDYLKGSARSVDGVNIYDAISAAKELLIGFGGHSQAAGISVEKDKFAQLESFLCKYLEDRYGAYAFDKSITVEWQVESKISVRFAKELERLEPFGVGNKKPCFSIKVNNANTKPLRVGSPHYSFSTSAIEMLNFNGEEDAKLLNLPLEKEVIFEINYSVWKNKESIKGYVKNIVPDYSDLACVDLCIFRNELLKLKQHAQYNVCKNIDCKIQEGYGTVYVVHDRQTLEKYGDKLNGLERALFMPKVKNFANVLVVSPQSLPEGYNKMVYLDKPMQYVADGVLVGDIGYKAIDGLNVNRQAFVDAYNVLCRAVGKEFVDSVGLCSTCKSDINDYQLIFATEVFLELGLFYENCGVLCKNNSEKRTLTDSLIYDKIYSLKG